MLHYPFVYPLAFLISLSPAFLPNALRLFGLNLVAQKTKDKKKKVTELQPLQQWFKAQAGRQKGSDKQRLTVADKVC